MTEKSSFTDVPEGRYFSDAVAWAKDLGIAKGMTATGFQTDGTVSREQTATFLYRYATEYWKEEPEKGAGLSQYTDAGKTFSYAEEAMAWATVVGFLEGLR